jgi:hypothetical protein
MWIGTTHLIAMKYPNIENSRGGKLVQLGTTQAYIVTVNHILRKIKKVPAYTSCEGRLNYSLRQQIANIPTLL